MSRPSGFGETPTGAGRFDFLKGPDLLEFRGVNVHEDLFIRGVISMTRFGGPWEYFSLSASVPKFEEPAEERRTLKALLQVLRHLIDEKKIPQPSALLEYGSRAFMIYAFDAMTHDPAQMLIVRSRLKMKVTAALDDFAGDIAGLKSQKPIFN